MFDLVILAAREDFLMGVLLPAGAGLIVGLLILNQLLAKWGYYLF